MKTWIFRYRMPDRRQPRFTIGSPPAIGLKDARDRAIDLQREVALGGDPATARKEKWKGVKEAPETFDDLARAYFEACETGTWKPKGKQKKVAVIAGEKARGERHVAPVLGNRSYKEIGRPDVKALLKGMIERGIGAQTNLTRAIIRQIYSYAISEDLVLINPAIGFPKYARPSRDPGFGTTWNS